MQPTSPDRRLDLDWLRIGAFALLILYHCGMFYVTWDWHVKSSRASDFIEPAMLLVNPWRLTLLFIISGCATRFMADKLSIGALAGSRMGRLWPPLILAVLVIVPPQSYYEVVEAYRAAGYPLGPALENFWVRYVTASGNWCDADGCLITPTYNHMWFVAYLIIYTLVLLPLIPLLRRAPKWLGVLVSGPGLFLAPFLFLLVTQVVLAPRFEETHAFWNDWYLHTLYFGAFLFGYAIAKHQPFFEACARWRWLGAAAALTAWAALMAHYDFMGRDAGAPQSWFEAMAHRALMTSEGTPPLVHQLFMSGLRELQAWTAILALFGFAYRHLRNADGPIRRYLTLGIFPFYLVHQTAIVVAGHYLDPLQLPLWLEGAVLIAITLACCIAAYEIARRVPWLSIWFGLRSQPKAFHGKNAETTVGERT